MQKNTSYRFNFPLKGRLLKFTPNNFLQSLLTQTHDNNPLIITSNGESPVPNSHATIFYALPKEELEKYIGRINYFDKFQNKYIYGIEKIICNLGKDKKEREIILRKTLTKDFIGALESTYQNIDACPASGFWGNRPKEKDKQFWKDNINQFKELESKFNEIKIIREDFNSQKYNFLLTSMNTKDYSRAIECSFCNIDLSDEKMYSNFSMYVNPIKVVNPNPTKDWDVSRFLHPRERDLILTTLNYMMKDPERDNFSAYYDENEKLFCLSKHNYHGKNTVSNTGLIKDVDKAREYLVEAIKVGWQAYNHHPIDEATGRVHQIRKNLNIAK